MNGLRVINSVQQIQEESNNIISIAKDIHYMDCKMSMQILKNNLDSLLKVYNETPEDSDKIDRLKVEVETNAINCEYFIQAHSNNFKERYSLRQFIKTFYSDVIGIFKLCVRNKYDNDIIVKWATYSQAVLKLYIKSNHLLFELAEYEEELIKSISKDITIFYNDNNIKYI